MAQSQYTIGPEELSKLLEPIIRRVVREELDRIIGMNPNIIMNLITENPAGYEKGASA